MSHHIKSLLIEKMVTGGYGLGRSSTGKVVLVHGVIPGERVDVHVFRSKKKYDLAFVTAISKKSAKRLEPTCPLFMQCGGCTLQHLAYDDQVQYKKDIFLDDWTRFFGDAAFVSPLTFYQSANIYAYRQRIRLHLHDDELCFYRHHSTKAIPVDACFLAHDSINTCLEFLDKQESFQDIKCNLRELVLHHNPALNQCVVELFSERKLRPADKKRIDTLLLSEQIQSIRVYGKSDELLLVAGDPVEIRFSMPTDFGECNFNMIPGDFCQINMEQNNKMLDFIMKSIDHDRPHQVLDLFCGLGNFSIPLAKHGHRVTGIDLKRSSIRSAEKNCTINKTKASFVRMSAIAGIKNQIKQKNMFDVILLDPPRAGFKEGAHLLHTLNPTQIFYIACDQQTQMRDLRQIIDSGYRVKEVCLFDMFPQTHHLESLVVLEKESGVTL